LQTGRRVRQRVAVLAHGREHLPQRVTKNANRTDTIKAGQADLKVVHIFT
jgi:hypothetical protein